MLLQQSVQLSLRSHGGCSIAHSSHKLHQLMHLHIREDKKATTICPGERICSHASHTLTDHTTQYSTSLEA